MYYRTSTHQTKFISELLIRYNQFVCRNTVCPIDCNDPVLLSNTDRKLKPQSVYLLGTFDEWCKTWSAFCKCISRFSDQVQTSIWFFQPCQCQHFDAGFLGGLDNLLCVTYFDVYWVFGEISLFIKLTKYCLNKLRQSRSKLNESKVKFESSKDLIKLAKLIYIRKRFSICHSFFSFICTVCSSRCAPLINAPQMWHVAIFCVFITKKKQLEGGKRQTEVLWDIMALTFSSLANNQRML